MQVKDVTYSDFETFYRDMLPNGRWGKELCGFIFRGESTTSYDLLPSSLRPQNRERLIKLSGVEDGPYSSDEAFQIRLEYGVLKQFYRAANSSGLYVPSVKKILREYNDNDCFEVEYEGFRNWLPEELIELASLAQHSGLPTRLLDWTYDFNVALYFASSGACARICRGSGAERGDMVIWALDAELIDKMRYIAQDTSIEIVMSPYVNNGNLNFQKGLFTYIKSRFVNQGGIDFGGVGDNDIAYNLPLNQYLETLCGRCDRVVLYRFLLPIAFCRDVLCFLDRLGCHAASLFPGYAGVKRRLDERVCL